VLPSYRISFTVADSNCAATQLCPPGLTKPQAKMPNAACQEPEAAPEAAGGAAQFGHFTGGDRNSSAWATVMKGWKIPLAPHKAASAAAAGEQLQQRTGTSCSSYTKAAAEALSPHKQILILAKTSKIGKDSVSSSEILFS